jgi:hypothetical protein
VVANAAHSKQVTGRSSSVLQRHLPGCGCCRGKSGRRIRFLFLRSLPSGGVPARLANIGEKIARFAKRENKSIKNGQAKKYMTIVNLIARAI